MKQRRVISLIVLHALLLMTAYVLQGLVFPYLRIFGMVPVLLPLVSIGAGVFEGSAAGGTVGLFAGILCDVSFNQPAATLTVLLAVTGIFAGVLADTVMARGFPTYVMLCAGTLLLVAFTQMFSLLFFEAAPPDELMMTALYQTLYSLVYTIPLFFIARALGRHALGDGVGR